MSTNVGAVDFELLLNSNPFNKGLQETSNTIKNSGIEGSLKKIGKLALAAFSVKAVVDFGKTCVNVATETSNAWIGLNSILTGQKKSFQQAKNFINDYISDGLVPLNNAVTAYKNLAARGYNSEQIEKTMTALKNSATFGRYSTYSLGEAVQSASEGLKNENSILVDNAGVTKNVAKMWEDYAKEIGTTSNKLTQQQKIQAEVNGILEETKFQMNDADIYTRTYSGVVARLSQAFTTMKVAIGNVIQPIAKLFIPIITTAVNAVTELFTALSGVMALFGLKADSVETISNGIGGIASDASNASEEISGIGSSAKKTAKELKSLTAFDTAQVLKNDSESTTDESLGGSVLGNLNLSSGINGQVEEINSLFNNINLEPLKNSFDKINEAVKPIITNIKDGLKWLYDNVLLPIGEWTVQDVVPTFLNLIAEALNLLNPLIEAFEPIFMWFWDNFLQPIALWTGGTIVKILTDVGDALSEIGNWMNENESTVTKMEIAVLGFFGAWKLIDLMSFIAQSGGVVKALTTITSAIKKGTVAKLIDKAETIYLKALYAKDFVLSIAKGTAALVKNAAQWVATTATKVAGTAATVASTVATGAATAATWLFNAALTVLTSPITLVIVAIAALVAGIYLLIKNWDKVKETAQKCWEGIKKAFSNIGSWFSEKFQQAYNAITKVFSKIGDFFSNVWNNIKGTFTKLGTSIGNAISNAVKSGINGVISMIEKTINKAISLINGAIGVINLIPGVDIGKLNKLNLPRLAEGGYVKANTPQLAMIGDNRHQGEVVAPEDKLMSLYKKANQEMGLGNNQKVIELLQIIIQILTNLPFDFNLYIDGDELNKRLEKIKKKNKFATNGGY